MHYQQFYLPKGEKVGAVFSYMYSLQTRQCYLTMLTWATTSCSIYVTSTAAEGGVVIVGLYKGIN